MLGVLCLCVTIWIQHFWVLRWFEDEQFYLGSIMVHSTTGSLFTALWLRAWELSVNYFVNKSTRDGWLWVCFLLIFDPQLWDVNTRKALFNKKKCLQASVPFMAEILLAFIGVEARRNKWIGWAGAWPLRGGVWCSSVLGGAVWWDGRSLPSLPPHSPPPWAVWQGMWLKDEWVMWNSHVAGPPSQIPRAYRELSGYLLKDTPSSPIPPFFLFPHSC